MRSKPFTPTQIYGINDEDYASYFSYEGIKANKARLVLNKSMLKFRIRELSKAYREGGIPKYLDKSVSIDDIEDLLVITKDKLATVEVSLERWTKLLKIKKDTK